MKIRDRILILIFLLVDLFLLNAAILIISFWHNNNLWIYPYSGIIFNLSWLFTFLPFINEKLFIQHSLVSRVKDLLIKALIYLSISSILIVFFNLDNISRVVYIGSFLLFFFFKYFISYFYSHLIRNKQRGEHYKNVLVIGAGVIGKSILEYYKKNPDRGQVIGYLDDFKRKSIKINVLGKLKDFELIIKNHQINDVIIALNSIEKIKISNIIKLAEYHGVRPRVIPDYYAAFNRNLEIRKLGNIPLVNIREVKLDYYSNRFWKRAFDLGFSIIAIILCMPLFILVGIIIKFDSKGPILYKPLREGKDGKKIHVYKFRSMIHSNKEVDTNKSTVVNDSRITKVGKVLRKYSIDELPQLFNVLFNSMSIVGPRPHRIKLNVEFKKHIYTYNVRQYIRPGITGWAQVNGWRGPTVNKLDYYGRALHDIWYIENWSFALDIYIIYLTIFGKKVRKNAF